METGIKRGADMIRQVLSFAKGTPGEVQAVRIEDLVHEVMGLAHDLLPKSISIRTELEPDLWPVMGDPTQLMQVLVNLVTNARDAMGTTGTLTIRTSNLELSENYSSVTDLAMPGRYVSIELEDTGHGMDQQTAAKIFEPFYTTKEIGHGTGLGLATSLAIVRSHGGFIHLYSEPDHGTRFQVHLPATEATHSAVIPPEQMPLPRGSGERILVIDDEAAIRHIVRQTLDTHGYRTEVAANGREGINAIEKAKEPFDLFGWISKHPPEKVEPIMESAIKTLKEEYGIKKIGAVGYCFGGRYSIRFLGKGLIDAGVRIVFSFLTRNLQTNLVLVRRTRLPSRRL